MISPGSIFFLDASELGAVGRVEVIAVDQIYCCNKPTVFLRFDDGRTLHVCQSALFPYHDKMNERVGNA